MHAPEIAEFIGTFSSAGIPDLYARVVVRRRRLATKQLALYGNDNGAKYHAVVTNRDLPAAELLA